MERRNFIIGLGALSAGGAAAVGTGAFSSVTAARDISVEVAEDSEAYLALQSESEYAEETDGTLALDFTQEVEGGGEHMGERQVMEFGPGDSFDNPDDAVFSIENRGTEEVQITRPRFADKYFDEDGELIAEDVFPDGPDDFELFIALLGKTSNFGDDPDTIAPGERSGVGVQIAVGSNPPEELETTFEILAEETDD